MKGAAQVWFVASMLATLLVIAGGRASAVDVTDADRTYRNYTREAATVGDGNVRIELRGMTVADEGGNRLNIIGIRLRSLPYNSQHPELKVTSLSGGEIDLLGSYGLGKNSEIGFILPGLFQSLKMENTATGQTAPTLNAENVGDLQLYGKFKHTVAEHCVVGGGVELTMPNGPRNSGLSRGEFGATPALSTRYERGRWALGINAAYEIYTGDAVDVFDYGVEGIVRVTDTWAFRTELAGQVFKDSGHQFDALQLLPGIDFNLSENMVVRPTGMVGLTNSALDWGIGAGLAFTFPVR